MKILVLHERKHSGICAIIHIKYRIEQTMEIFFLDKETDITPIIQIEGFSQCVFLCHIHCREILIIVPCNAVPAVELTRTAT